MKKSPAPRAPSAYELWKAQAWEAARSEQGGGPSYEDFMARVRRWQPLHSTVEARLAASHTLGLLLLPSWDGREAPCRPDGCCFSELHRVLAPPGTACSICVGG
jgi:hypothetical protein